MTRLIIETDKMTCTRCNRTLPATEDFFYKQKYTDKNDEVYYKLSQPCKECRKSYGRNYYSGEDKKKRQKLYHAKWTRQNRDREAENKRRLRKENPEHYKKYSKKYQIENIPMFVAYARKRKNENKNFKLTKEELKSCKEYFNYCCAYCGMSEEEHKLIHNQRLHREHVIVGGRNNLTNCVPSCKECNSQKSEYSLNTWYNKSNKKYSRERYVKIYNWIRYDSKKYLVRKNTK